jgi:HPr kinase/phosphorylase
VHGEPDRPAIHGTAIESGGRAALIRGPSGSGKSDLALRCISAAAPGLVAQTARLVADDYVYLVPAAGGYVDVVAPAATFGKLEVRGVGIVTVPATLRARLSLVVDLVAAGTPVERLPDNDAVLLCGCPVAHMTIHSFESSAPLKVLLALAVLDGQSDPSVQPKPITDDRP